MESGATLRTVNGVGVIDVPDLAGTMAFGRRLGQLLFPGAVVALAGPLGAGKTHLVRAIAEGLGVDDSRLVNSPTFVLIQEYDARLPIYHFDAYRLHSAAEFAELGVAEYFQGDGVCLIEWADRVKDCLPSEHLWIEIESSPAALAGVRYSGPREAAGQLTGVTEYRDPGHDYSSEPRRFVLSAFGEKYLPIVKSLQAPHPDPPPQGGREHAPHPDPPPQGGREHPPHPDPPPRGGREKVTVLIIGGGLAGLAAATALAPRGFGVTLLESRNRLGGRASSFQDAASGTLVDACQHVSMGCCTNLAHFCRTLGIDRYLERQPCLYFMTPDRRISRFRTGPWPAPFHLAGSFLGSHYLTALEKLRIAFGLACLQRTPTLPLPRGGGGKGRGDDDPPFQDWLLRHWQTPRTVDRFWGLVLVSALNESPDRVGLRYARKVFVDGFLRHRRGFEVELSTVPLGRLYGEELLAWLKQHAVDLQLQSGVKKILIENGRVAGLLTRDDRELKADWYIAAVPFDRLLDLLPEDVVSQHACLSNLRHLETSPITSVHLWYDRPVLDLPHVVLIDCVGQWVFNRGQNDAGENYVQVVVSAARQFRGLDQDEIKRRVCAELAALFPGAKEAAVKRARVITEHSATFSAVPGVDRWRPSQATPIDNLFLAGDWTATGWPATMEGAVRSGYLAAEALLSRAGQAVSLVQADLR